MSATCSWCGSTCQPHRPNGSPTELCSPECRRLFRLAYLKKWQSANKDELARKRDKNRDQVRAWDRQFYARHRERRKKLRREQYHRDPERYLQQAREYAAANPDLIRAIGRRSRSTRRFRLVNAFVEAVDPQTVFDRDKGICGLCQKVVDPESDWHVDHVVPLAKGGQHAYDNVQLAHGRCNRKKGARVA